MNGSVTFSELQPGDPAPWFVQDSTSRARYHFDTVGGRYVLLGLFLSASDPAAGAALDFIRHHRQRFDDHAFCFFGVSADPHDRSSLEADLPGIRYFWDEDLTIARLYGAAPLGEPIIPGEFRQRWVILDPAMRVAAILPISGETYGELTMWLTSAPPLDTSAGERVQAPVLILPNVFDDELCQKLVGAYDRAGGHPSGVTREVEGGVAVVDDSTFKIRRDVQLVDVALLGATLSRVRAAIIPQIERAFQFRTTRIERHIVASYAAIEGGHFAAHRDNTTPATAHRRFAVSVNLNSDFQGGELGFPEYGPRTFKPSPGSAVVFSCSLLHRVTQVRSGRRLAYLPFLYDEAAAAIREQSPPLLGSASDA